MRRQVIDLVANFVGRISYTLYWKKVLPKSLEEFGHRGISLATEELAKFYFTQTPEDFPVRERLEATAQWAQLRLDASATFKLLLHTVYVLGLNVSH